MDLFAPRHLLVILVIALVVFGGKKLKTLGSDLGGAIRGFKQAMKEGETAEAQTPAPVEPSRPPELPRQTPERAATSSTSSANAA